MRFVGWIHIAVWSKLKDLPNDVNAPGYATAVERQEGKPIRAVVEIPGDRARAFELIRIALDDAGLVWEWDHEAMERQRTGSEGPRRRTEAS